MPESDYYGGHGIAPRNDLAGLNLTTVPKVLIESGNMINATDAAMLTSPRFQRGSPRRCSRRSSPSCTGKSSPFPTFNVTGCPPVRQR